MTETGRLILENQILLIVAAAEGLGSRDEKGRDKLLRQAAKTKQFLCGQDDCEAEQARLRQVLRDRYAKPD
jgi:hypothetical protein